MIGMTEEAGDYLLRLLDEQDPSSTSQFCFRITEDLDLILEMSVHDPDDRDTKLKHKNRTVLVLDTDVAARYQNMTLDVVHADHKDPQFVFVETPHRTSSGSEDE